MNIMNQDQIKNILKYIENTQEENVKINIFNRLGYECFYCRKLNEWIKKYQGNIQSFFDRINIKQASPYWERLELNKDKTMLIITGKKVKECACAFSDSIKSQISLCKYYCKNFQQEMFGMLLNKNVEFEITESFLMGDERCNTKIHIKEDREK